MELLKLAVSGNQVVRGEMDSLVARAVSELPEDITDELQSIAWIAKRIIELSEKDRRDKQTIQLMITTWLVANDEYGYVWMNHPNNYQSLREFLYDVGTEEEGNKLSPSVISEIITISEIIVPYCRDNGIDFESYITGSLWTKVREVVSYIRRLIENNNNEEILDVLDDVRTFPSRDALRFKYRSNRGERRARSECITRNGTSIVVTVVPTENLSDVRRALGRYTEWDTFTNAHYNSGVVDIKVRTQ